MITLTSKIDELRQIYRGLAKLEEEGRTFQFSSLILAGSSDEAIGKFREFLKQEHPSGDWTKAQLVLSIEYVLI